jgi:hypothetical protein
MSSFTNLTNSFKHMGLEEQKKQLSYHELRIEYPVLDLLPAEESVTPLLSPRPSTAIERSQTRLSTTCQSLAPILSSDSHSLTRWPRCPPTWSSPRS